MLIYLFLLSAVLFGLVTWFCHAQGLFDAGPTRIFAFILYVIWFAATGLATATAAVVHLAKH